MAYSTILPAPGTYINAAGVLDKYNGMPAPGFKGVGLKSNYDVDVLRSRSNRGLPVTTGFHYWSFSIDYHPMTEQTYSALESFLLGHNTRKNPFYVILPNYNKPNQSFYDYARTNTITIQDVAYAGESTINIGSSLPSNLLPGCFINLTDDGDALHKNVYKVARVESNTAYSGTQPLTGQLRLTLFPPLQRDLVGTVTVNFIDPKFRVIQTGDYSPSYDENNLITFGIQVEEIMP